jgi:hypothetical protein
MVKAEFGIGRRELPFDLPVPGQVELRSGLPDGAVADPDGKGQVPNPWRTTCPVPGPTAVAGRPNPDDFPLDGIAFE